MRRLSYLSSPVFFLSALLFGQEPPFDPVRVVKAFPPIEKAEFIPASRVEGQVIPEELVLGVVVGGKARAYPIDMITGPQREIINDFLGGKAIAATW